jgi:hypothetical protein
VEDGSGVSVGDSATVLEAPVLSTAEKSWTELLVAAMVALNTANTTPAVNIKTNVIIAAIEMVVLELECGTLTVMGGFPDRISSGTTTKLLQKGQWMVV